VCTKIHEINKTSPAITLTAQTPNSKEKASLRAPDDFPIERCLGDCGSVVGMVEVLGAVRILLTLDAVRNTLVAR
jgi:hypothetical protein